ncbi:hypothetical protein P7C73_g2949, partial [Tremellales sp. Uapishka_1]
MFSSPKIVALLALASLAAAVRITSPSNTTGWESSGANVIEWTSVSTDSSTFTLELIEPSSPNSPVVIANVTTSAGSYTYTPSSSLTAASEYRVNAVNNGAILAQSDYFQVESGSSTVSASSSSSASASSSSTSASSASASASSSAASATSSSLSASASASASSGSSSASIPSSSNSSGDKILVSGGLLVISSLFGIML